MKVPSVVFKTRVRDNSIEGDNPLSGKIKPQKIILKVKKKYFVFFILTSFTPTCSTFQLPNFEKLYNDFKEKGIDEIYCMSVNDSFVMNKWAQDQDIKNVKVIPDGNGEFTKGMDMLVNKNNLGFGYRSWRYVRY